MQHLLVIDLLGVEPSYGGGGEREEIYIYIERECVRE